MAYPVEKRRLAPVTGCKDEALLQYERHGEITAAEADAGVAQG